MKFFYAVFAFALLSCPNFAFNLSDYRFHTMPETSYYGGIHSIAKDSIGRIWFSGYDALFMYNGKSFVQMNELVTSHSPGYYWTYGQVITDSSGKLYVATNHGLLRFNYKKQIFQPILKGNIGAIASDGDGNIWLVVNNRVRSFGRKGFAAPVVGFLPEHSVLSTLVCCGQNVYIGAGSKVYRLNKKTNRCSLFSSLENPGSVVRDILEYNNSVYVLTHADGVYESDKQGHIVKHYPLAHENGKSTISKKLYLDASNTIWIATQSGLFLLDPAQKQIHLLRSNLHYAYSLPNNSVWSIFPDPDGGVWIGTYGGKLAYMTFSDNDVNYFKPALGGLNHPIVSCFEEDEDGSLWIGTEGGGLNYWNRKTDEFRHFTQENKSGITSNMIKNLHRGQGGQGLLVSTFNGGMLRFERPGLRFVDLQIRHPFTHEPLSVYDFAMDAGSGIWMTNPDSQLIYKEKGKPLAEVASLRDAKGNVVSMHIETLFFDKGNRLWLITRNGLYIVNAGKRLIEKHYYIPNTSYSVNNLCSFCITSDSEIWFGTRGGGANKLSKDGGYSNFSEKEGLMGKTVFGILEDTGSKNVWFSTNDGLYYYSHKTKKIQKFPMDIPNLCGAFYVRSCFKTSRNEMLFGGTKGFIMFTPGKIKQNSQKPKVFFTDLLINNKKVIPGDEKSPLKQDISTFSYTKENNNKIILSHKQSNIEIRVSANSYLDAEKNRYSYRMIGLSDKWYLLPPGQKSIQFFNLPAGKYIFEVKAANNDGVRGDQVSALYFQVLPSPFFSFWAYTAYFFLLMYAVYFIWRYFTNKKIFAHRLEMEKVKEQNMKKLTQARINFFTNISHDLKTPLTLVIDPLKQLKEFLPEDQSPNASAYIHIIEKNVNRIQRMISQLLQFREIESQKITFNPQPGDLVQYIRDIFSLFELYANKKGIETQIKSDFETFYTSFDHDIIEKIFTNLFSNAMKYTFENGYVDLKINKIEPENLPEFGLRAKSEVEYISVATTNTGTEIPEDKKEAIFESFNRLISGKSGFEESTGLGLAIVKELVDSIGGKIVLRSMDAKVTFTVVLPFTLNMGKANSEVSSYDYAISEIDNILAQSQELDKQDKRSRKMHTIVVIEDDADLRTYMEQRLSEFYNVHTAKNGNEGIAKTERIFPQMVITDLMMPEADGFDVCRSLRSNIKTSHIPIVVLSALGRNTENKIKALESGANVFIDKPFDMDYLLRQVDNLIKSQNELKEAYSKRYIAEPSKITFSSADEELLRKAMECIEENIGNIDYNVESFVSDMAIGRTLLYQKINDILGMSIKEFIMDVRLKRGAQLLEESDMTVSEISDMTGFNNPKYFSICFKKNFGLTPSEFRKKS